MLEMQSLVEKKRETLHEGVLQMGELVTAALRKSLDCLRRQDPELAHRIRAEDQPINQLRRMLEQECLVVLAAHQPAGPDLRRIGASLQVVSELERIADHAADVAQIVLEAGDEAFQPECMARVAEVGVEATAMVSDSLAAFGAVDAGLARATAARDDAVDAREREVIEEILGLMRDDRAHTYSGTRLLWALHNYERAADRATNIAERVVFAATGELPDLD